MAVVRRGVSAVLLIAAARTASAQQEPLFTRLYLDKLRLESLGAGAGRILPSQVEPTILYTATADYGEIVPSWRVLFGVSYWGSRYRDNVVQAFVDTLNAHLSDRQGATRVLPSRISLYDITFSGEARYVPRYSGELKPYIGVGLAAHVINAEGALINGTFVERSLDDIAAGLFITGGVSLKVLSHFGIEGGARADLLSGFRSTQVRAGAAYYFGRIRGSGSAPGPSGG